MINLNDYQLEAIDRLRPGAILYGGVGSGKSRTALAYYYFKECEGTIKVNNEGDFSKMKQPKDLYIITTAKKRDDLEWEKEFSLFGLSSDRKLNIDGIQITIDSWNNIKKYIEVENAFFIFDEQRLVGYGAWVKAFLKINKVNNWIILSATPGDTWMDYIPVFIANGFYKNKTQFVREHVVYSNYSKYPKIDHYICESILQKHKKKVLVEMKYYNTQTSRHKIIDKVTYDKVIFDKANKKKWNVFTEKPCKNINEYFYVIRKITNIDQSRMETIKEIAETEAKLIIFYNFDYELEILRTLKDLKSFKVSEWNGHKHEGIPNSKKWIYLVQYNSGSEGWNCVETNCIIFYSLNYSYKIMHQASGRIDRINSPFKDLNYHYLISDSWIDLAILKTLKNKKNFNESNYKILASHEKLTLL